MAVQNKISTTATGCTTGAATNGIYTSAIGQTNQYIISNGSYPTWSSISSTSVAPLVINGGNSKEIVRVNSDGTVTWADTIDIDAAVDAFSKVLTIHVENSAGLTTAVKQRMRDIVFEEIISIAKEKGSLTADDLTYLHQAAKMIDKLKGK